MGLLMILRKDYRKLSWHKYKYFDSFERTIQMVLEIILLPIQKKVHMIPNQFSNLILKPPSTSRRYKNCRQISNSILLSKSSWKDKITVLEKKSKSSNRSAKEPNKRWSNMRRANRRHLLRRNKLSQMPYLVRKSLWR